LVERGNPPQKITLILNTANEGLFKFNSEREFRKIKSGVKILYHGTIAERFGLHNVIVAMSYLLKEIPDSILNIYGRYEGSYLTKLERLVKDLELSGNVNLNGKVVREEIPKLINNHDVGIVPYLKTDYMNLALPTKAFEYIAMGLPLVSTKLKDLYETFDDNCIKYVDKSDPKQIAGAISFLCSNPSVSENFVQTSHRKLSEISGEVMKERFIQTYEQLTSSKPGEIATSSTSSF
jgi:glycosyltransferase involved in cell wall biosynthesis